jgi:hypothetical protein
VPLLDALVGLLVVVFLGLVGSAGVYLWRNSPKRLGGRNLKQFQLTESSVCPVCGCPTTPRLDLYVYGAWFHAHCFGDINKEI